MGLGYRWHSLERRLAARLGGSVFVRQLVVAAAFYFAIWGLVQVNLPFTNGFVRLIRWAVAEYQPKVEWDKLSGALSTGNWQLPALPTFKGENSPASAESLSGYFFPVDGGKVVSRYGWRIHPVFGDKHFHQGIDIAAPQGAPVKAIYGGYVSRVGDDDFLGRVVEINHGNGLTSLYGHLGEVLVKERQVVRTGEVIAEVGVSGITNGPHLHLEIKERGVNVDPAIRPGVVEEPVAPVLGPVEGEPEPGPAVGNLEGAEGAGD